MTRCIEWDNSGRVDDDTKEQNSHSALGGCPKCGHEIEHEWDYHYSLYKCTNPQCDYVEDLGYT